MHEPCPWVVDLEGDQQKPIHGQQRHVPTWRVIRIDFNSVGVVSEVPRSQDDEIMAMHMDRVRDGRLLFIYLLILLGELPFDQKIDPGILRLVQEDGNVVLGERVGHFVTVDSYQ